VPVKAVPPNSFSVSPLASNLLCHQGGGVSHNFTITPTMATIFCAAPRGPPKFSIISHPRPPSYCITNCHCCEEPRFFYYIQQCHQIVVPYSCDTQLYQYLSQTVTSLLYPQNWDTQILIITPNRYYQYFMPHHAIIKLYFVPREVSLAVTPYLAPVWISLTPSSKLIITK
jgi:hypothetical protein